ncbi:MAG: hypothetical protein NC131_16940 [Roseburia sp.]|nr:hypothetical protein [Roseburia sp.]
MEAYGVSDDYRRKLNHEFVEAFWYAEEVEGERNEWDVTTMCFNTDRAEWIKLWVE